MLQFLKSAIATLSTLNQQCGIVLASEDWNPPMRWVLTVVKLVVLVATYITAPLSADAADVKRLALVIANAAYVHTPALKNPINDAASISDHLRELGFDVQLEKDVGARACLQLRRMIAQAS
jgi:hypothetical protein